MPEPMVYYATIQVYKDDLAKQGKLEVMVSDRDDYIGLLFKADSYSSLNLLLSRIQDQLIPVMKSVQEKM